MKIRYATKKDLIHVVRSLQNKKIEYNTTKQAKQDIMLNRLIVICDNNKIIGSCALVEEKKYNYFAIKRMCIYNKKNCGKGFASLLVKYVCDNNRDKNLGATPWNNPPMIKIFEKHGFVYQYTFLEKYNFYLKSIDKQNKSDIIKIEKR